MKKNRRHPYASLVNTGCLFVALFIPLVVVQTISSVIRTETMLVMESQNQQNNSIPVLPRNRPSTGATSDIRGNLYLRYNWMFLKRLSSLARKLEEHQNDCSLSQASFRFRNRFGLGSDLHVYSQALCNALETGAYRVSTIPDWIWLDHEACGVPLTSESSPMHCYFPSAEPSCASPSNRNHFNLTRGRGRISNECPNLTATFGTSEIRAATTEFLFTRVSSIVQMEATRQLNRVFRDHDNVPARLITVHIRWGDKGDEMKLVPITSYIEGVNRLIADDKLGPISVFLATEDPEAVNAFRQAAPEYWQIYVDEYFHEMLPYRKDVYNGSPLMSKALSGRPGLVALGSLLVSMEANAFVLTTNSNWSRLMNEIRKNIINPRCGNCTKMIDLSQGEW